MTLCVILGYLSVWCMPPIRIYVKVPCRKCLLVSISRTSHWVSRTRELSFWHDKSYYGNIIWVKIVCCMQFWSCDSLRRANPDGSEKFRFQHFSFETFKSWTSSSTNLVQSKEKSVPFDTFFSLISQKKKRIYSKRLQCHGPGHSPRCWCSVGPWVLRMNICPCLDK